MRIMMFKVFSNKSLFYATLNVFIKGLVRMSKTSLSHCVCFLLI